MTNDTFSDLLEIQPEQDAWPEYKDARDALDNKRSWAVRALEAIEDHKVSIVARDAIEAAFEAQRAPLAARYNHIRAQHGLEPLAL